MWLYYGPLFPGFARFSISNWVVGSCRVFGTPKNKHRPKAKSKLLWPPNMCHVTSYKIEFVCVHVETHSLDLLVPVTKKTVALFKRFRLRFPILILVFLVILVTLTMGHAVSSRNQWSYWRNSKLCATFLPPKFHWKWKICGAKISVWTSLRRRLMDGMVGVIEMESHPWKWVLLKFHGKSGRLFLDDT